MERSNGLPEPPLLLLDACCAINLLASGAADEILESLASDAAVACLVSEEEETYVNLALQLDDGEAATGALAIHRGAVVATDDRKAIRILTGEPLPWRSVGPASS